MPATPKSQLQKECQKEIKRQGFKIKVVEKAGIAIKRLLQKSDPFKPRQCERVDCLVCRTKGKGPCDRESVTYEIQCTNVAKSTSEKHEGARIHEGKNTQNRSAIKKTFKTFKTLFSILGSVVKHGLSCLMYYIIDTKIAVCHSFKKVRAKI